jgi:elongation factor G
VTPKTSGDAERLAEALRVLASENVRVGVRRGARHMTVISATSEPDLERVLDRLARRFGVEAEVGRPRVEYRETVTRSSEASVKLSIPNGRQYAHVAVRVRPGASGSGARLTNATLGGCIPVRFMPSVERGIRNAMNAGPVAGYPVIDVHVEVYDGSYHRTHSTPASFQTAAAAAFLAAAQKADAIVLAPVMEVVVRVEDTYGEAVAGDLLARRGALAGRTRAPDQEVVTAHVPLSELFGYESSLRELTRAHGTCSIRFLNYRALVQGPDDDQDRDSRVTSPRRPQPHLRTGAMSVPEPDDAPSI